MLDSIYDMTLKYFLSRFFGLKTSIFCNKYAMLLWA